MCWLLTNITWSAPSRGFDARETFKVFRKKTSFSLVCIKVLHQVDKKTLCPMSVLKYGWMSTSNNLLVFTAVIRLSVFAQTICQTILSLNVCKIMNIPWTGFLSQHGNHVDCLLLFRWVTCSCCCYEVLYVSSHVNVWNFTWNVHPLSTETLTWTKTFHERVQLSHGSGEHSFFFNLFDFQSQFVFHTKFRLFASAHVILPKTLSCFSVKIHFRCFGRRHQEIQFFSMLL